ncbi:MAG: hypothetical protein M1825_002629 [Sarcosagium campestre]|nr:MAG: hypothetical protein M1825_002629 [Sarcosagium campestre]
MFAKSRQLQWQKPLEWTSGLSEDDISEDEMELSEQEIGDSYQLSPICHPHEWYLPETGRPQRCCTPEGEFAVNLTESSFNIQDWALSYRPRGWPDSFDFPQDPSNFADCKELFPNPLHCRLCLTVGPCACGPAQFFNPLVELVTYKGKGRGVRTLQDIPEDTYIAEFAGEIVPNGQIDDYDLDFSLPQQGDEAGRIQSAGLIRPVIRGNFTRYINHSCDPGSEFFDAYVGGKIRQVVKTIKRVPAFTELTVHYGSTYWLEEWRSCACGEEKCEWSKEAKLKKARQIGESSKMDTSPG